MSTVTPPCGGTERSAGRLRRARAARPPRGARRRSRAPRTHLANQFVGVFEHELLLRLVDLVRGVRGPKTGGCGGEALVRAAAHLDVEVWSMATARPRGVGE